MKIAQVAPLYESVPPKNYGGTERIVSYLTEELVGQGHQVTLFASGDSITKAELISPCGRSLRLDDSCLDAFPYHFAMLEEVLRQANRFDLIHFHTGYLHLPLLRRERCLHVTTQHGRLDAPEQSALFREYPDMPMVSISDSQRRPVPWLNWQGTVLHGLPIDLSLNNQRLGLK
jgi:glycosyltransferase involved in cell wall biosynthesis